MNTTSPISTISYNSDDFLQATLTRLVKSHIISFGAYVSHCGEPDDEAYGKDHKHLLVIPNKRIDTMCLREDFFMEYDPNNPDKPFTILDPTKCKSISDWYLYGTHNPVYLASKGEERTFVYGIEDFWSTDPDTMSHQYFEAFHSSKWATSRKIIETIQSGANTSVLVDSGMVPLNLCMQVEAYNRLRHEEQFNVIHKTIPTEDPESYQHRNLVNIQHREALSENGFMDIPEDTDMPFDFAP